MSHPVNHPEKDRKEQKIMDAITDVPDKMIKEAAETNCRKITSPFKKWQQLAAAACILLILAAGISSTVLREQNRGGDKPSKTSAAVPLLKVTMPEAYAFDDYETRTQIRENNPVDDSFLNAVNTFSYETASALLTDSNKNINYSPLSLYYALALAASGADGETEQEFWDLLHVNDSETLSDQCGRLYRLLYLDNEFTVQKIANSLWMDDSINWKENFIQNASDHFYASVFSMDLSDENAPKAMSEWISEQTENNLAPEFKNDPEAILTIINTVHFRSEWIDAFDPSATQEDTFYLSDGSGINCEFMNAKYGSHGFAKGSNYVRSNLSLKNGSMVFILPDDGISPRSLIDTPEKMKEVFEGGETYTGEVTWKVPKFDFASDLDLTDTLKELGMTSAFEETADFSKITDSFAVLSQVSQGTHISINEEGVSASSYTALEYAGAAIPTGSAEMILDRPFLYGITASDGTLLFVGICDDPAAG